MNQVIDIKQPQSPVLQGLSYYEMLRTPGVYKSLTNDGTFVSIEDGVIGIQGQTVFVVDPDVWVNDKFILSDAQVNLQFSN